MRGGRLGRVLACGMLLTVVPSVQGQQPPGTPPPSATRAPMVVQIGVDIVQIDAVVTEGKRHVTDLKAEDFEVYQDGKRCQVTHCRYVVVDAAPPTPKPEKPKKPLDISEATPPPTPVPLARDDVRRAMALVVDDLNLGASSIHSVRHGLRKFVEDEMRPGDVVALLRTRGGTGVLQQFTNDKRVLLAAIEDLLYYPPIGFGDELFSGPGDELGATEGGGLQGEQRHFFNNMLGNATLNAIMRVLQGLRELPGRKSVTLFSERLYLLDYTDNSINPELQTLVRRVTDLANRASVVIYTVDPRGLPVIGVGADVSGRNMDGAAYGRELQRQTRERFNTEAGLAVLAEQTGGIFFAKENRPDAAIRDVMEDQKGYYLLAYVPDEATFPKRNEKALFHNLKVEVKRPGLKVRTRAGFLGEPDRPQPRAAALPTEAGLLSAAMSPFVVNDVAIRLTSIFGHDPRQGYVVRSFVHVDGAGLTFRKSRKPGMHETKFQLAAAAFGDNGEMMQDIARDVTFPIPSERVEQAQREGVLLVFNVPLRKPGAYQFRTALRDAVSNRFGSAQQFVYIPDLGKKRLALSGVLVGRIPRGGDDGGIGVSTEEAELSPAVRRFPAGAEITYGFAVYHPQTDKEGKAQLDTEVRLVRDGKEVARHQLEQIATRALDTSAPKADKWVKRVPGFAVGGGFRLPKGLEPGDYALQMIVTDRLAKGKHNRTAQWTAFQIVAQPQRASATP